jgi:hypothetical protein
MLDLLGALRRHRHRGPRVIDAIQLERSYEAFAQVVDSMLTQHAK